ncbi:MAG: hypothetical protein ABL961_01815 [Vicinamibacterales bacterium]
MTLNSEDLPFRVPPYEVGNWQEDYGAGSQFWSEKSPVSYHLFVFHRKIEGLLHRAARQGDLRAMLFSDGAFVVMPSLERLAVLSGDIMRVCLLNRLPVRMGLAVGTFQPVKFGAETIGDTGIYTSLFYGTGVVRAHYAESDKKTKGMRILVHPSAIATLPGDFDGFKSSPFERIKYRFAPLSARSEPASHEFEYLYRHNPPSWKHPGIDNSHLEDQKLWDAVVRMKTRAPSDSKVQVHYDETLLAINRMRLAVGRPAFALEDISAQDSRG